MVVAAADLVSHLPPAVAHVTEDTLALGKQGSRSSHRLTGLTERLADLDAMGIAIQAVSRRRCNATVCADIAHKAAAW
jgi:hypothetical protein